MSVKAPTLFLISGKIAAGKSTLAGTLAEQPMTVLLSQDHWLSTLFPAELSTLEDYRRCSARVRAALGPHIESLLQEGISVVMDFPANTLEQRAWLRALFEAVEVNHELHYLDVTDDVCRRRLHERNDRGDHPFRVSDAQFDEFTSYFVPPAPNEGFNIVTHTVVA